MSDSVRPQRRQPTRLPCPWDSPGKNTGVGCHFLPQCMTVKSESEVIQSCLTLSDPRDCSLPGSSVHGFSRQEYWSGVPLEARKTWAWSNRTDHVTRRTGLDLCAHPAAVDQRSQHQGLALWRQLSMDKGEWGWSGDNSSASYLLCTLRLLLLNQLHLRSSGIRSRRLGTPALE